MKATGFYKNLVEICNNDMTLERFIHNKVNSPGRSYMDDSFCVCDLGDIIKKHKRFYNVLPRVEPFFAVKCNPDKVVLRLLADLGYSFDCASKQEMQDILDLGVSPEKIIFANPCKQMSFIKYAAGVKVSLMTFDNEQELYKVKQHYPDAQLVIRIKVDDSKSACQLGIKFGASVSNSKHLLEIAKNLGLNVVGVSFHVGSGCYDANLFYKAVQSSHLVFKQASEVGFEFHLLDIGGGFSGDKDALVSFEEAGAQLNLALDEYFPEKDNIRIIAEPGRYYVASAFTTVCNVIASRVLYGEHDDEQYMYYFNDGVYGTFNCIIFEDYHPVPIPLVSHTALQTFKCSLWGPTCDSLDCILKETKLPKLNIGDWVYFKNMGAYTLSCATTFNGFSIPDVMYMCREQDCYQFLSNDLQVDHMKKNEMISKNTCKIGQQTRKLMFAEN